VGSYTSTKNERRGETMGLWNVQTWTVSKGKLEEHEEIMRKMQKISRERPEFGKKMKYFRKRWGPWGGRVLILKFEDMADYENYFAKVDKMEREEDFQLRKEWAKCIEYNTWKSVFWIESSLE